MREEEEERDEQEEKEEERMNEFGTIYWIFGVS